MPGNSCVNEYDHFFNDEDMFATTVIFHRYITCVFHVLGLFTRSLRFIRRLCSVNVASGVDVGAEKCGTSISFNISW